jgi:hypothetical protein
LRVEELEGRRLLAGPALASIAPTTLDEGSGAATLTVGGSGFQSGSVVDWNGAVLPTQFVGGSQLTATVPASDLAEEGHAAITIINPDGSTAGPLSFTIADAPLSNLNIVNQFLPSVGANPFLPTVATFFDANPVPNDSNPISAAADFTATITFSNGESEGGIVEAVLPGAGPPGANYNFVVVGRGPISSTPAYVTSVTIRDVGGSTITATAGAPVPTDGPILSSVQRFGFHAQPTTLVLNFDSALAPSSATDLSNYSLQRLTPRGQVVAGPRGLVPIVSASYNPDSASVTLHPARRLNVHSSYFLIVNGTPPNGVSGPTGLYLDGQHLGHPSGDATAVISYANLVNPPRTTPLHHPLRAAHTTRRG